jgi:hypothetical protein
LASDKTYKLYLDVCCLNRPFDDQNQTRIRLESEALLLIISRLQLKEWEWIGSDVINFEISRTPDPERHRRVKLLASTIHYSVQLEQAEVVRAKQLEALGFKEWDALHLACAESGGVDIFLTTDDKLLNLARRVADQLQLQVDNPLTWLTEITK